MLVYRKLYPLKSPQSFTNLNITCQQKVIEMTEGSENLFFDPSGVKRKTPV
jgi:hypothetical protein